MPILSRISDALAKRVAKSLYDLHPELRDREPLLRMQAGDDWTLGSAGGSFRSSAQFYEINVWVQTAIKKIADNIAPLQLEVWDRVTNESRSDHELIELFLHVNGSMDPSDLWRQWVTDMLLGGESGLELVRGGRGQFVEVWPRDPSMITVSLDKAHKRYGGIAQYVLEDDQGQWGVPPEDFVFYRFYNPLNHWRGLSPIKAIQTGIMIDEFSRAWAQMFFKNSARPDFAVISPEGLSASERAEIEAKLSGKFGGLQGSHKAIVLEQGVTDVKPLSFPPKDIEWLEQRRFSRSEIAAMLGVPDEVMGYGRDTYENYETAIKALWTLTLIPLVDMRDARLTEHFRGLGLLKPTERIRTDVSQVEALQEDRTGKIEQATRLFGMGVPANQAFEYAEIDLDVPGGDVSYLPITLVPAGRSPLAPTEPRAETSAVNKAAVEFGSDEHRALWERKAHRTDKHESSMIRLLRREFQRQQNEVNRRLRNTEGHALGRGHNADVKQNVQGLFDMYAEIEAWRAVFGPEFAAAMAEFGIDELLSLGLDISFDLNRPEVQAELGNILAQFAEKVNDTTYNDLVGVFAQAEAEGAGVPQIIEMLSAYWEGRKDFYSCERIARTTMTSLNNAADEEAWGQTDGMVVGSRWLSQLDKRTRPEHIAAHNQARRNGEMFDVGGEMLAYPGDPNGSAGNIINCRCTRTAILVGEEFE